MQKKKEKKALNLSALFPELVSAKAIPAVASLENSCWWPCESKT
jgi:hypothetical protein